MMKKVGPAPGCCEGGATEVAFPPGLADMARVFKALSDEARLKLLHLVSEQEICVCDLTDLMGMPQGTLSHHLSVLQQAGLISARKQGRWNYYQATALAKAPLVVLKGE